MNTFQFGKMLAKTAGELDRKNRESRLRKLLSLLGRGGTSAMVLGGGASGGGPPIGQGLVQPGTGSQGGQGGEPL